MAITPYLLRENHPAFVDRMGVLTELVGNKRKLALRAGISNSGIRHYLFEQGEPTRPQLIALAQAAEVNVSWLVTGEGAMRPVAPEARQAVLDTYQKYVAARELSDNADARTEFVRAYNNGVVAAAPQMSFLSLYELNDWLAERENRTISATDFADVPYYDLDDPAIEEALARPDASSASPAPICFRSDLLVDRWKLDARQVRLFAVSAEEQFGPFRSRDWVLCDCRLQEPKRNGIYLVDTPNGVAFRRVQFLDGGRVRVILERYGSQNMERAETSSEEYAPGEIQLIGRAFGLWRRVRL